jgi:uncharacterized protein (DUF486 family)
MGEEMIVEKFSKIAINMLKIIVKMLSLLIIFINYLLITEALRKTFYNFDFIKKKKIKEEITLCFLQIISISFRIIRDTHRN